MRTSLSGKFRSRRTPLATLLLLVAVVFSVRSLAGQQCLEVEVLDPSSAPVSNATVSIGNREQSTDGSGLAIFCELGAGSHWIIVSAAGFQPKEASVQQAESQITFVLQLATLSEDLVVVGTRTEGRDPLESSVPVERIRGERLRRSGAQETGRSLQMESPSFNFSSSSISDGTDALRPATLRGLGPDQTLVLVKRLLHKSLRHVRLSPMGQGASMRNDAESIHVPVPRTQLDRLQSGADRQGASDLLVR